MTGWPILLPMCKCRVPPGRNWNENEIPVGEVPGSTATVPRAMDQLIMGTMTHLHHQSQVRVVESLVVDIQGSLVPPLFQLILPFPLSTNLPLQPLQFLPTLSFTSPPPLCPPPSPSPPPPPPCAPPPSTALSSPSPPPTQVPSQKNLEAKECWRWRRSWTNR